jgi:predicted nucleotidyltransferase
MIVQELKEQGLLDCPTWLPDATTYLTITGSTAYGVSTDNSDLDMVGLCMPPLEVVFPHTKGIIVGFGNQGERFGDWQLHHVKSQDGLTEYDFTIYNIVKFFELCMGMNPNMVDVLFTPEDCLIHTSKVSEIVRANRKLFLHKGAWHKFKGYAFSQMKAIKGSQRQSNEKRKALTEKYGYDVKYGYHVVRLMLEVEQILSEGDLDLRRNVAVLNAIRGGEWSLDQLQAYFAEKEVSLERVYEDSKLPYGPDEGALRAVLLTCMEEHYGSLAGVLGPYGG